MRRARRGQRLLSWRLRPLPGQRVRLFERGTGGGMHALRTVSKRRGTLRFRPALGLGRRRQIVAVVESRGFPRASLTVARFKAPRDSLPSRPKRVTLKRANGNRLVIRWSRSRRARRYAVNLRLRDGRRVTHVTRKRRLVVGRVPAIDAGTVQRRRPARRQPDRTRTEGDAQADAEAGADVRRAGSGSAGSPSRSAAAVRLPRARERHGEGQR